MVARLASILLTAAAAENPPPRTCDQLLPEHPDEETLDTDVHCLSKFAFCGFANCTITEDLPSFGKRVAICGCAPYGGDAKNDEWDGAAEGVWESQTMLTYTKFPHLSDFTVLNKSKEVCPHGFRSCGVEPPATIAPFCDTLDAPVDYYPGLLPGTPAKAELEALQIMGDVTYISTSTQCDRPVSDEQFLPESCGPKEGDELREFAGCMLAPCYNAEYDGGPAGKWPVTCICDIYTETEVTHGLKNACHQPEGFIGSGVPSDCVDYDPTCLDWRRENETAVAFAI